MFRNALIAASVAVFNLLALATTALAADPTKVGKHVEDIVSPNVKSFWKVGLVVGVLVMIFGRLKTSVIVAFLVCIVVSGAVIYNPGGVSEMVQSIGNKVL